MRIVGQRNDEGALASHVFSGNPEVRPAKAARFAKLAIAACTATMLVGLYVGMKYSYAIGTPSDAQSRVFHIDVSEACLHGTEPAPVFEAHQGDHVVLAVTSLYSGGLISTDWTQRLISPPAWRPRLRSPPNMRDGSFYTSTAMTKSTLTPNSLFLKLRRASHAIPYCS